MFEQTLLDKALADCDVLLGSDTAGARAQELEAALLQQMAPANLRPGDAGNAFLSVESSFERACIHLEAKGVARPGELSLFAFYSRVRFYAQAGRPEPVG